MYKKTILVLIIVLSMFSLSGCNDLGIGDALALDENLHIKFEHLENDRIMYQDNIYYLTPITFLQGSEEEIKVSGNYTYVGWTGSRFFYKSHIFADSIEAPTFLYSTNARVTYLREDYDYLNDTFLIEGTKDVICFGNDLLKTNYTDTNLFNRETVDISISSVEHPTLTSTFYIVKDEGVWYAINNNDLVFRLSDNFVNVLTNNKIIFD